jgi:hypothetical protein
VITSGDYLKILEEMTRLFVSGVQKNPRVLAFSNVAANFKMFLPRYSRSDRMAEIYHELFYDPASGRRNIAMRDLVIHPFGGKEFSLRRDNTRRQAKVPMLIINATTLNTGRNFQFTAIDMGERFPLGQSLHYDKNPILQSFRYDELPADVDEKYRDVPLGVAVAASACVPGIFHPLALTKLYKKFTPQLVDGGVHDNQGLESLFYERCTDIIVSDASGQMDSVAKPSVNILSVAMRSNSVLQNRLRNLGLELLQAHPEVEQSILHMRAGLDVEVMKPNTSREEAVEYSFDKQKRAWVEETTTPDKPTDFGIPRKIQLALSKVRTDLDAFSDVETESLMYNGYRLAETALSPALSRHFSGIGPPRKKPATHPGLDFTTIKQYEIGEAASQRYFQLLTSAENVFFKVYDNLSPFTKNVCKWLTIVFWLVSGYAVGFGSYYIPYRIVLRFEFLQRIHWLLQTPIVLVAGTAFFLVLAPLFVAFIALGHLVLVNPAFLRRGKIQTL